MSRMSAALVLQDPAQQRCRSRKYEYLDALTLVGGVAGDSTASKVMSTELLGDPPKVI